MSADTRPTVHDLKTGPEYFVDVEAGRKPFELRRDDRGFAVGDYLRLREWSHDEGYSGAEQCARVTYILRAPAFTQIGLVSGFVVLAIELVGHDTMRAILGGAS